MITRPIFGEPLYLIADLISHPKELTPYYLVRADASIKNGNGGFMCYLVDSPNKKFNKHCLKRYSDELDSGGCLRVMEIKKAIIEKETK